MNSQSIDGLINLNKPTGITSAKALYRMRKITGVRKSGHTGTLDPLAKGVLVLCLGKATKLVEKIMSLPKVYRATARLDVTSATLDAEGEQIPVPVEKLPTLAQVQEELLRFEGSIQQTPPAISAIKIGGVPAYKLARAGKTPELKPREVQIHWVKLHSYAWPLVDIEIACGRGTYIRSLVRDLGERLGAGGCLTHLSRLAVGPFHIAQAVDLSSVETREPTGYILPLAQALELIEHETGRIPARPAGGTLPNQ